jgi:integrase
MSKNGYKINEEDYLKAVRKTASISNKIVGDELRLNRSTIHRFLVSNPDLLEKAKDILTEIGDTSYSRMVMNYDLFLEIPVIVEWQDILKRRMVSNSKKNAYLRTWWHVCKYLRKHPSKISPEESADLNQKLKELYYDGKKQPPNIAYTRVREAIRSFYTLTQKISGEYLSSLGVTKESIPTLGRYAKQWVQEDVRHRFEKELITCTPNILLYEEVLALVKFMFYTGSRVSASICFNFRTMNYTLEKNIWILEILDKGEKGGKKWRKIFIAHALEYLKEYCSKRFKIPIEDLEKELPRKTDNLFPSLINENKNAMLSRARVPIKKALIKSGLPYDDFPPCHIWRHTFAQSFLRASGWNYELTATLGGWTTTHILKKHYGEMGMDVVMKGLQEAMGIKVTKEVHQLKW